MDKMHHDDTWAAKRTVFFKLAFGRHQGYVCLAFLREKKFEERFFSYPEQLAEMQEAIDEHVLTHNVYFCPQLLSQKRRTKESVSITPNLWSDLDTCNPDVLLVEPTIVLESSPNRFQALWCLDGEMDADDAEALSRRIAYRHAEAGADRSGWDLTQLLRVPYTYNLKYQLGQRAPLVDIQNVNRNLYRAKDFDQYPETSEYTQVDIPMPSAEDMIATAEELLQARRMALNPLIWKYFTQEPETDWSRALWNLQMLLFEAGYDRIQVYIICREAKCNKYARDGKPALLLWKEVCRADARAAFHEKLLLDRPAQYVPLLSDEENAELAAAPPTFVERYIEWASTLGDAAPQYHQAGAFTCLSAMLCGSVRLPTSYGTIIPNVWFMILADTTLTRKTTAMDIAMDLLIDAEKGEDAIMATDGSIEGLLSALSLRTGRPSIFLRDEFSGLLEQMTKKDYMAGMPELLTKLYDGKLQKRILRKETIEVKDPRLIVFAGGIKNKITGTLSFEHVSSGFMPRFVFICAESDIKRLKPIGPPSARTTGNRDAILDELVDIGLFYNREQTLTIEKLKTTVQQRVMFDAVMTEEGWIRYNELETALLEYGLKSDKPDIMTPVGDRLSKSILKCALLIAASRQKSDTVTIEKLDILRAIKYGEQWRAHAQEVMDNVGKGETERRLDTILNAIKRKDSVSRSQIMQAYHLTARDASVIFETLEQRGLITRQRSGRTELLTAR